jgi:EAL domain-containing protein (putative c-di-GMP-specific phosphodiesterase class I)/GGDEF domain-containing protein
MSLQKQLWLAVILLLAVVCGACFIVGSLTARDYLERQLGTRNADVANALALALTQQGVDPTQPEPILAEHFDTGLYALIQLADPQGSVTVRLADDASGDGAPDWYARLFPIDPQPGVAQVTSGPDVFGTLTVRTPARFDYAELWRNSARLGAVFLVAMLVAGLVGSYLLRRALRPLDDVVEQAKAIGERRFMSIPEPAAPEFSKVASAMNELSRRVRSLLTQEAGRMEKQRRDLQADKTTGLPGREQFMKLLAANLERDDESASGALGLVRLDGLTRLNQAYGRKAVNELLGELGAALGRVVMQNSGWSAGRLNGSDFALLAPRIADPAAVAREAQQALREVLSERRMLAEVQLPGAATAFTPGEAPGRLLTRLDGALQANEAEGESGISVAGRDDVQVMEVRDQLAKWRVLFREAFAGHSFSLDSYPVTSLKGQLLHYEAPVRLQWQNRSLTGNQILPWIHRLELASDLDKHVVELALRQIEQDGRPLGINLSTAAVADGGFLLWLNEQLSSHAEAAGRLWMEIREDAAYRYLENFEKLCARARAHDTKMGVEHVGYRVSDLGQLHQAGLDFLKIDAALVRGIDHNEVNQALLRTLCSLGHAMQATMIAEGVQNEAAWRALQDLGVDAATGPWVSDRYKFSG